MRAVVKYTLGRLGLLLAILLVLFLLFPRLNPLVTLLVAFTVSLVLSWFLLRGWRDEMSRSLAEAADRRRESRERLRAALAGEDAPGPTETPTTREPSEVPDTGGPEGTPGTRRPSGKPEPSGPSGDSGGSRRAD